MNVISDEKMEQAIGMFLEGASIREVVKSVGIARGTAHKLQKITRIADLDMDGKTRVNTGKRADGSIAFYESKERRPHWQ